MSIYCSQGIQYAPTYGQQRNKKDYPSLFGRLRHNCYLALVKKEYDAEVLSLQLTLVKTMMLNWLKRGQIL